MATQSPQTIFANDTTRIQYSHTNFGQNNQWSSLQLLGLGELIGDSDGWFTIEGGASASLSFNGTGMKIYGTVPANDFPFNNISSGQPIDIHSPHFMVTIDGMLNPDKVDYLHRQQTVQPHIIFYTKEGLPDGLHTVQITSTRDHGFLILDSVETHDFSSGNTPPSSSESTGPSATSTPGSSSETSSSRVNTAGIVGGVIAALVVIASVLAFFLWRRRRRVEASRRITPFGAAPYVSEYSKSSSPYPEPIATLPASRAVPSTAYLFAPSSSPTPPPPTHYTHSDLSHEPPPSFVAGPSDIGRHGSLYKPRQSVESLPPTEYGYGVGISRDEWSSHSDRKS